MKTITVFTPTYNRAHLLPRLYESLVNQTSQDFVWMVIDDGSVDATKRLVEQWQKAAKIDIEYHYKSNGGMHTGHNLAYQLIETELNVCIDSDDYMPLNAISEIVDFWKGLKDHEQYSGFIGLDVDVNNKVIGSGMPKDLKEGSYLDLYKRVNGDKKFVLVTKEVRKFPRYPEYDNEKLVPLGILYIMMGENKHFAYLNKVLCVVDYQIEGSSHSILKQYRQSPKGFAYARKIKLKYSESIKDEVRIYTHLISSSLFAKDLSIAFTNVNPLKTFLIMPFGLLFHIYVLLRINYTNNLNK